jgi:hypothetical protein
MGMGMDRVGRDGDERVVVCPNYPCLFLLWWAFGSLCCPKIGAGELSAGLSEIWEVGREIAG